MFTGLGMRPRKESTISQYIEFVPVLIPRPHSQTSFQRPHSQPLARFCNLNYKKWAKVNLPSDIHMYTSAYQMDVQIPIDFCLDVGNAATIA